MKHLLPKAALTLLSLLGLGSYEARASHAQGGDLRYEYIGNQYNPVRPNLYKVTCRFFRDCSGIDAPTSLTLNARVGTPVTSCNSNDSRNTSATLTRQGLPVYGNQYCATTTGVCSASGPDNYEENLYVGTVTLATAPTWTMSVVENARPTLANIGGNTNIVFEAVFNNQIQAGGQVTTITNSSPNFGALPAAFVGWQQAISLNLGAFDADGDSLAYSLVSPLTDCNTPSVYPAAPIGGNYSIGTGCTAAMPATMLSATYPLPSAQLTGACPVRTATPYFLLDAANGTLRFTPIAYTAGSASSQGLNKYALSVKVDEYRRLNGAFQHIGSTRREIFVNVYDCGQNQMPRFASTMQVYGMTGAVALATPIPVRAGAATSLVLTATDANAGQRVLFTANHMSVPGVSITQTGATTLAVEFSPPATLPTGTYYVTVRADDDNCPVRGFEMQTLAFRVTNTTLSSHGPAKQVVSSAFPNPFAEQVSFSLARPTAAASAVEVVDQLGRVVERLPVPAGAGPEASLTWRPAPGLPAGVYLARFPQGQQTVRLMHLTR
ncbi:hypothetical protein [Hymenobacter edaphi]|uniref:Secretion system C-terminal sorting domain-containing protein n=1 Tax=Hymenobacter edaphi TaxID=2211146 RepID=A0A328BQE1_9BACT|nr:hypothetical protein [Hymenobacter edaphi]RAK69472.1 hypothetical protein DLM85_00975 [Hymenobacter edaphi]